MEESVQIKIQADLKELKKVRKRLEVFFSECGVREEEIFQILLMVDEVTTNTIKYGYEGKHGTIEIQASCRENRVEVIIEDEAPPFNPLAYPSVDIEKHIQQGRTHGLGIHVLRTYADECQYERVLSKNRLIIRKHVGEKAKPL
ncbi:MAG: ATP-binding protein [Brevinematales bacterium]|nr:ATP-binding protein [Brevinematales bacterium]